MNSRKPFIDPELTFWVINYLFLGSKDQYCIKKEFKDYKGNQLNSLCNAAKKNIENRD